MRLDKLLDGVCYRGKINPRIEIYDVVTSPEDVFENTVYVAIRGQKTDGHRFVEEAVERGAACIVCEKGDSVPYLEIAVITVENTRKAYAVMCANLFQRPSEKLKTAGITGTNGKTTVSYMLGHILAKANKETGIIGTLGSVSPSGPTAADKTTPEAKTLQSLLAGFVSSGCRYAVMEASSQGLEQYRTEGILFDVGVFTNLSEDHLDYHKNMDAYFLSKKRLAYASKTMIVNADDPYADRFADLENVFSYSLTRKADFTVSDLKTTRDGSSFFFYAKGEKYTVNLSVPGLFNVSNAAAALSAAYVLLDGQLPHDPLADFHGVKGRLEKCETDLPFDIFIDFAHTPAALEQVLITLRSIGYARILLVFGCGGDRDREKRAIMGKIASLQSDLCVITSDNPRSEEPEAIICDILSGVQNSLHCAVIPDRQKAILFALDHARAGDAVLLAGKGHEKHQWIKEGPVLFDERDVIRSWTEAQKRG